MEAEPVPAPLRVLVVDDDALVRSALRRMLSKQTVETSASAQEALELLTQSQARFDVILCDLMMPEMSGLELHAELLKTQPESAKAMVFLTGGVFNPAIQKQLEATGCRVLEKPVSLAMLRQVVAAQGGRAG